MRKQCVLKPESDWNTGDRVFWYDHPNTGDKDFDESQVTLYNDSTTDEWFLKCHISRIQPVEEHMVDNPVWGRVYYLKSEFSQFKS